MYHDFTDSYSPHIAIERDLNSYYIIGIATKFSDFEMFFVNKVLRRFYCIRCLLCSSTKFLIFEVVS